MFWSSRTSREDIGSSDDSDIADRHARHRSRAKRDSKTSLSKSWIPAFFGSSSARTPILGTKKSRRRDRKKRSTPKLSSRAWGLLLLSALLVVYLCNFYRHIHHVRIGVPRYPSLRTASLDAIRAIPERASQKIIMQGSHRLRSKNLSSANVKASLMSQENSLAVGPNTGILGMDAVKSHYRRLAKHYLGTFAGGIYRQLFFDVLRRRTYALTPPGANKGVQCILFQIINKRVYMMDPYEVPRNSKPFYRTRINEVIWILSKLAETGRIRDTEFLVAIHDCVQTVNKPHMYRGAHYQESNPTFTIVSCNFSNNIPFPMWEGSDRDGGFLGWDAYARAYAADSTPWNIKKSAAVFRGSNRPSMYFRNKDDADRHCNSVGRTRLIYLQREHPESFDVSVAGRCGGQHHVLKRLSHREHHRFKYIMYMEGNCGWADRLRHQIFGPSAIIKQETPCRQFFEPLMAPLVHYIPTDFFLTDTIKQISWARQNDDTVQQIVKNANEFASNFLTRSGIEAYIEVLLDEYTQLLVEPDIKLENGAVEVTNKKV